MLTVRATMPFAVANQTAAGTASSGAIGAKYRAGAVVPPHHKGNDAARSK